MEFKILCLDAEGEVECKTRTTLLHTLMGSSALLESPSMDEEKGELHEEKRDININVVQFPTDQMLTGERYSAAFTVSVHCNNTDSLDDFRILLVDYIKKIGFSNIRILMDDVSMQYAEQLYPILYRLENHVRAFVVNFFLKNLGPKWTTFALSADALDKIKKRQKNDKIFVFSKRVESDVSLIDFDDLGRILYNENSILSYKKADNVSVLIEKIASANDLEKLKDEVLRGNFYKYFKDCFTQKDFQNKWEMLYYYRNKIAHNGSFSKLETCDCREICEALTKIIDGAYEKLDTFKLSETDQEALMMVANEYVGIAKTTEGGAGISGYEVINEDELLSELRRAEDELNFVGLRHFVVSILGQKGYDYAASFALINYLVDKGTIKMSQTTNEHGRPITVVELPDVKTGMMESGGDS